MVRQLWMSAVGKKRAILRATKVEFVNGTKETKLVGGTNVQIET